MEYPEYVIGSESRECMMCSGHPCESSCPYGIKIGSIMQALKLRDERRAEDLVPDVLPCINCTGRACMSGCLRSRIYKSVDIPQTLMAVSELAENRRKDGKQAELSEMRRKDGKQTELPDMSRLETEFLGVKCENPFFLSSSVVASGYDMIAKAFRLGWAGIAYKTIGMLSPCAEASPRFDVSRDGTSGFTGLKNIEQISDHPIEEDLDILRRLKTDFPTKVIIVSIMGRDEEEWKYLARKAEEAGADIIELNFSCPHMSGSGLGADVGTDPELTAKYTAAARKGTSRPILAKMTPNVTNMELPAIAAVNAGADGISAINTVKSIINVDLDDYSSGPSVRGRSAVGGYSGNAVRPMALRFISDMKHNAYLKDIPVSGMGGIENWHDAAEFISLGCGTVQVTTAVMQYGYGIITDLMYGLASYLTEKKMNTGSLCGKALSQILSPEELDRESVLYPKIDHRECVECGRCVTSCYDAGHQALSIGSLKGTLVLDPHKCVGCHLCIAVCPTGAMSSGTRVRK